MSSVRMKRRFFLVRFLRRWFYHFLEHFLEEEAEVSSANWQRHVLHPCTYCQRPIVPESLFCPHCGFALATRERQTTGAQKLILAKPDSQPVVTLTDRLASIRIPNEKHAHMKAYHRLKGQK